ncbi:hypothetical protein DW122_01545 [Bifidobacterium pseudocatenulatum]|nr:hypothetical protein DW122_01545 [Bifidobacterium pseudocatenulatum]
MQFGGMILPVTGGFWTVEGLVSGEDSSTDWKFLPAGMRFGGWIVPVAGNFGRKSNEIGRHCAERGISRAHYMPYGKLRVSVFQA